MMRNKIKEKEITFTSKYPNIDIIKPLPASRYVPEWYRNLDGVVNGINTVKKCVPVLDSLTAGYIIELPSDVIFDKKLNRFDSNSTIDFMSDHYPEQISNFPVPVGFSGQPHKWTNNWEIKTPKGYSTLFIHPLNSPFLPFYSFSGIVDTDKHPLIINFPFILREDFSGVIPAGTPIIQIIPFKRENWKSNIIDDKPYSPPKNEYEVMNAPFGWYKKNFWSKKTFR